MKYPDCFGKLALAEPETMKEKGCIRCPHWNSCQSTTWITRGQGLEAWLAERKKEEK